MGEKLLSERLKNAAWLDNLCINPDLDEIADEVAALEARLAQAEAERDKWLQVSMDHAGEIGQLKCWQAKCEERDVRMADLLAEIAKLPRYTEIAMSAVDCKKFMHNARAVIFATGLDAVLAKYRSTPAKETQVPCIYCGKVGCTCQANAIQQPAKETK